MEYQPPEDTGLEILLQDNHLLIVNKPAGLLSVPGKGPDKSDCFYQRVCRQFPEALVVHRLDMATSGLMVFALSTKAQSDMAKQFEQRDIRKTYIALVDGIIEQDNGKIDAPLIRDWPNRPRQKVDHESGKPSLTGYRVICRNREHNISTVELEPFTGRTHQLRVHCQTLGHPILGDRLYATESAIKKACRLMLHASNLEFKHPITQQTISVQCPPPATFNQLSGMQ